MNHEELKARIELLSNKLRNLEKLIPEYEKTDWLKAAILRNNHKALDEECLNAIKHLTILEEKPDGV